MRSGFRLAALSLLLLAVLSSPSFGGGITNYQTAAAGEAAKTIAVIEAHKKAWKLAVDKYQKALIWRILGIVARLRQLSTILIMTERIHMENRDTLHNLQKVTGALMLRLDAEAVGRMVTPATSTSAGGGKKGTSALSGKTQK